MPEYHDAVIRYSHGLGLVAMLPEDAATEDPNECVAYYLSRPHDKRGHANYVQMMRSTRPATDAETEMAVEQLEALGLRVIVRRRAEQGHEMRRLAQIQRRNTTWQSASVLPLADIVQAQAVIARLNRVGSRFDYRWRKVGEVYEIEKRMR